MRSSRSETWMISSRVFPPPTRTFSGNNKIQTERPPAGESRSDLLHMNKLHDQIQPLISAKATAATRAPPRWEEPDTRLPPYKNERAKVSSILDQKRHEELMLIKTWIVLGYQIINDNSLTNMQKWEVEDIYTSLTLRNGVVWHGLTSILNGWCCQARHRLEVDALH